MLIEIAGASDAEPIADLVRRAFRSQAELYDDDTLPPLAESAGTVLTAMSEGVVLKAVHDGTIVGSVRGMMRDGTCLVGRLVVEPDHQGRGIGRALARAVEERFPQAERFEIFTGHLSESALRLYESLGYRTARRERMHERLTLIHLTKRGPGGA